jgi:uncharacterized membrane protein (DUF485 family)
MTPQGSDLYADRTSSVNQSIDFDEIASAPAFAELRHRYRRFVFPATMAFLSWYLLYVAMSNWAGDFMNTRLIGNINVALVFGLLQFATTFALAWLYGRYATAHLDPLARKLSDSEKSGSNERPGA